MKGPHLVYIADPMCSWCWGFSPAIDAIQAGFGTELPIRLLLGGLRPGTDTEMDSSDRADVRAHWEHIREASGQTFDFGFFDRARFVYDTEPASRAVVVMRRRGMDLGLAALKRIQSAFHTDFQDESARRETHTDFAIARKAGVRGFPTLIAGTGKDGRYSLVTNGFQPATRIIPAQEYWLAPALAARPGHFPPGTGMSIFRSCLPFFSAPTVQAAASSEAIRIGMTARQNIFPGGAAASRKISRLPAEPGPAGRTLFRSAE